MPKSFRFGNSSTLPIHISMYLHKYTQTHTVDTYFVYGHILYIQIYCIYIIGRYVHNICSVYTHLCLKSDVPNQILKKFSGSRDPEVLDLLD